MIRLNNGEHIVHNRPDVPDYLYHNFFDFVRNGGTPFSPLDQAVFSVDVVEEAFKDGMKQGQLDTMNGYDKRIIVPDCPWTTPYATVRVLECFRPIDVECEELDLKCSDCGELVSSLDVHLQCPKCGGIVVECEEMIRISADCSKDVEETESESE